MECLSFLGWNWDLRSTLQYRSLTKKTGNEEGRMSFAETTVRNSVVVLLQLV